VARYVGPFKFRPAVNRRGDKVSHEPIMDPHIANYRVDVGSHLTEGDALHNREYQPGAQSGLARLSLINTRDMRINPKGIMRPLL